jgi:hypothetical protein
MTGPWVKLWRNVLTDEKLHVLTEDYGDKAFRIWITLLARCEDGVVLDERRILESITQTKTQKLATILENMASLGMIELKDSQIVILKWKEHQEGTSTHRTRAFRERKGNATGTQTERVEDRREKVEEEEYKYKSGEPLNDGSARIEKAREIWNSAKAGPPCRLTSLNMGPENRSACLLPLSAYSDEEIAEAIGNYVRIKASAEHEVRAPYQSFVGFMRAGVEKFISAAEPFKAYAKKIPDWKKDTGGALAGRSDAWDEADRLEFERELEERRSGDEVEIGDLLGGMTVEEALRSRGKHD